MVPSTSDGRRPGMVGDCGRRCYTVAATAHEGEEVRSQVELDQGFVADEALVEFNLRPNLASWRDFRGAEIERVKRY